MDNLAILIPAYNEAQTIEKVVLDIKGVIGEIPKAVVYVYDNNSQDNTAELAQNAGAVVRHEYVQGKGAVIRRMFREIDARAYIMIDADDTYPVEEIPAMYCKVLERKVDMVVGDRLSSTYFQENKRPFHNVGNATVKFLINHLFDTNIKDILTGYRAFSYRFVKTFPVLSKGFEIETEMSIHAAESNMFVENQVVEYRDRPQGSESKLSTYGDGFKVILKIWNLFRIYHPLAFFGSISLLLAAISLLTFWFRVVVPYSHTGIVANMPTLVVTMIVLLAAIVSLFSGMILDAIQSQEKMNFEYRLIDAERQINNQIN
ncbi:MAG: glycosyltransferase family 2 protein [Oenococcus sp.]|uniref:Glycosyltransferase n=1 Tax=Oenococcus kitaharae DSM 17330 TaxID=1045004 RepID=G9WJB9_9LACO|nr:glycosyltransferase family 2 protein [Oenococcus kitaharae]EHN58725.1 Glycosyltransferase [Oenococcus kitaharae DSM 17330]MCV3297174.1 glycosyltransferase family 2 protein [Oenococcus kitaharae]OEY83192.1 glycosyl transferase family protein [Oenococcus kitaharae]OEY84286.1 glycosyl transferase family protein [Oenococcus kitaharae]OEY85872.1 glycosyl transferase family protein [Oenococcus kitaharae]